MKHILIAGLVVLLAGCGRAQPTLAHGKPVSDWVAALQHPDARQRKKAAEVLGNVGAADPAVVPALAGAVKDRDPAVRGEAVLALLKIGPAAREAAPALHEAEKDRDPHVRAGAVKALEKVEAVP
jgi:HEAT repeat protein